MCKYNFNDYSLGNQCLTFIHSTTNCLLPGWYYKYELKGFFCFEFQETLSDKAQRLHKFVYIFILIGSCSLCLGEKEGLGLKPRALCMLSIRFTTELHLQSSGSYFNRRFQIPRNRGHKIIIIMET